MLPTRALMLAMTAGRSLRTKVRASTSAANVYQHWQFNKGARTIYNS